MAYIAPKVGDVLPAQKNTTIQNPGAIHDPHGNSEWLQADAQDTAYEKNLVLIEEWQNAIRDNPPGAAYPQNLGNSLSWAVVVIAAEAGGIGFDQQRVGPAVNTLPTT
jgi:hypothetical protein